MKALIDADIVATPIGQCVVVPRTQFCDVYDCARCIGGKHQRWQVPPTTGDVLSVVETCGTDAHAFPRSLDGESCYPCDDTGHIRRGFVRVTTVLSVEAESAHVHHRTIVAAQPMPDGYTDTYLSSDTGVTTLPLSVSPGDSVLVVEPWCETCKGRGWYCNHCGPRGEWHHKMDCRPGTEQPCPNCKPTPVTVTHRDAVLGEIGDNDE